MNHLLFAAVTPDSAGDWRNFVLNANAKLQPHAQHVLRLAETVWLLNNKAAPSALAHLISYAENYKVPFAIAGLEAAPEWLPGGIDPKTILAQRD